MNIWIKKPYAPQAITTLENIMREVALGEVNTEECYVWHEGLESWIQLAQFLKSLKNQQTPTQPPEFKINNIVDKPPGFFPDKESNSGCNSNSSGVKTSLATENSPSKIARKFPKIIWAIIGGAAIFFFYDLYACIDRTPIVLIKCSLLAAFVGACVFGWLSSMVICIKENKKMFYFPGAAVIVMGLESKGSILLGVIFGLFPVIGAVLYYIKKSNSQS
jgi:hypothetical protein